MKKILPFFLAAVLLLSFAVTVGAADGKVTYDGNAKNVIFAPGGNHSPTDLFDNFKDVMPGDTLTQKITVKNDADNKVKVKIYLRSLGAHEDSVSFLSQLDLTVQKSNDNEMPYMFDAAADQTDGLTDWVCLGTLYSGGEVNLDVTLRVPVELGNDYKQQIGFLDWEFRVEEFPVEDSDPIPPQTGENSPLALMAALMVGSAMVLCMLIFRRGKEPKDDEAVAQH